LCARAALAIALALSGCASGCASLGGGPDVELLQEICAGPVPPEPRLEVLELTPAPGTAVDKTSVLRARLAYSLPQKWSGDVLVAAQFASATAGDWGLDMRPGAFARPALARGTVTLELPVRFQLEVAGAARPLRLRFVLQHLEGRGSRTIAETDHASYPGAGFAATAPPPTLTVRSLDPAPGEALRAGTIVTALLAYAIPGAFATGQFEIQAEVAGTQPGQDWWVRDKNARVPLTSATGMAIVQLPLAKLMQMRETRRPLKVRFFLTRLDKGVRWTQVRTPYATYDLCRALAPAHSPATPN
jgi:hypothetical protein